MKNKFIKCGTLGWCLEILWTGFLSFRRRDMKLFGRTSIWMFPIYGTASLFLPLYKRIRQLPVILRGSIYTFWIFLVEFVTGSWLKKHQFCPWDYSKAKYNLKGVIRLDYAPLWFITGLLMERKIFKSDTTHVSINTKKQGSCKTFKN